MPGEASAGFQFPKSLMSVGSQKDPVSDGERWVSASFQGNTISTTLSGELNQLVQVVLDGFKDVRQCPPLIDVAYE